MKLFCHGSLAIMLQSCQAFGINIMFYLTRDDFIPHNGGFGFSRALLSYFMCYVEYFDREAVSGSTNDLKIQQVPMF